jgi:hypothetical protein
MFARATRGEALVQANTSCVRIPLKLPLDSARHAPRTARGYSITDSMPKKT